MEGDGANGFIERVERVWPARANDVAVVAAIFAAALGAMIGSLPDIDPVPAAVAAIAGQTSLAVFTIEFALRLRIASRAGDRRAYAASPAGVIDLAVVVAGAAALAGGSVGAAGEVAGILALLKLWRFLPALSILGAVLVHEGRTLAAALAAMFVLLVLVSTVMFHLERGAQPEIFRSIPHTLWWGIVTMATVGYGDMAPVTLAGRIFGGLTMTLGIAMFAVPAGIIATGFADELRKREAAVTWQAVSRVPLFARLDAGYVSEIADLLRASVVPARNVVVRAGDEADAMFFIMDGEVEVDLAPRPIRLRAGDFFGEMALVTGQRRAATVTTVTECRLLRLGATEFRRVAEANPQILEEVSKVASTRAR